MSNFCKDLINFHQLNERKSKNLRSGRMAVPCGVKLKRGGRGLPSGKVVVGSLKLSKNG